jgi:hypothetical protein
MSNSSQNINIIDTISYNNTSIDIPNLISSIIHLINNYNIKYNLSTNDTEPVEDNRINEIIPLTDINYQNYM